MSADFRNRNANKDDQQNRSAENRVQQGSGLRLPPLTNPQHPPRLKTKAPAPTKKAEPERKPVRTPAPAAKAVSAGSAGKAGAENRRPTSRRGNRLVD